MHRWMVVGSLLCGCAQPSLLPVAQPASGGLQEGPGSFVDLPDAQIPGHPLELTVRGAEPHGTALLYVSAGYNRNGGACPSRIGGTCMRLQAPAYYLGTANADAQGEATFTVTLPTGLPLQQIWYSGATHSPQSGWNPIATERLDVSGPNQDYDGDGLSNLEELGLGTEWDEVDTDGDGLHDDIEIGLGSDPLSPDSDGDTWNDGDEHALGSDPTDPADTPTPPLVTAQEILLDTAPRGPVRVRGVVMRVEPYIYLQESGSAWAGMRIDGSATQFNVGDSVEVTLELRRSGLLHSASTSWHRVTPHPTAIVPTVPTLGFEDIDRPPEALPYSFMTVRVEGALEVNAAHHLSTPVSNRFLYEQGYGLEDDFAVGDPIHAVTGVLFFYYTATAVPGPALDLEDIGFVESLP